MIKFYKLMFFNTLVIGTLITISSYSWLSMWMGLEINLLSMLPLMKNQKNIMPSESALKYFITQALASSVLLFSIITIMNINEFIPQNSNNFMMMVMNSALLTKMGAAPFHFWFPEIMEGLEWTCCLIMLTWQKIAPMIILMHNCKMIIFLSVIIIFSSIVGGMMGLNQISLRKILAYSSINHMGWMIASMMNYQTIWINYFVIYSIISFNIIMILKTTNTYMIKQLTSSMNQNKMLKLLFIMNFLSLGGIPPLLGFFPKWLTINSLVMNNFFALSMILITMTLITLFFYLRLTFSTMVMNTEESLLHVPKKMSFLIVTSNMISLAGLSICTLIFNFY
uniref:NADH-ubiquinone oxidoreductase chain 2 n=1 Tax=Jebusaea hammerschmidtii TaxID=2233810 RepID=A0A8E8GS39_9CUCU|nr:NADH dehydrogenase subunit 2 [Jebusaea hammerschmidtii]